MLRSTFARLHRRPPSFRPPPFVARLHSTPSRHGLPGFVPVLLSIFKSSTALEIARTSGRIALTFVPLLIFKNHKSRQLLRDAEKHAHNPQWEVNKTAEQEKIKKRSISTHILISVPILLFATTVFAAIERTPLTGRWRLILLSPEEEDQIAESLAGPGWFNAVTDILTQEGPVNLIPTSDWRHAWVNDTLRRLERAIPLIQHEHEHDPSSWLAPSEIPRPPPSEYPLLPRPRAHEYIRMVAEIACKRTVQPAPHALLGPPYSLLLVDKPDALNAFSYGFGPDGGGGIVVYSGFIDNILSKSCTESSPASSSQPPPKPPPQSWLSSVFGAFFTVSPSLQLSHPPPTPEQTSELAILLAHELAHLILSHHLESLSSGGVAVPAVMAILADVVRAVIFPVTMILGPFVNDALAHVGKISFGEMAKLGENCTSMKQEAEADVVSARILAHAGFDPRHAISFWEHRHSCATVPREAVDTLGPSKSTIRQIVGASHPIDEVRVQKLKAEIARWETERQTALRRLHGKAE